jgi:hypothetical protein
MQSHGEAETKGNLKGPTLLIPSLNDGPLVQTPNAAGAAP